MIFGRVPIEKRELARLLVDRVGPAANRFQAEGINETAAWTKAVKHVLNEEAKQRGFEAWCSGIEGVAEWLYDLMWWRDNPSEGFYIALACESEWLEDPGDVSEDFRKLLCCKAPLKLLIYAGGHRPEQGEKIRARVLEDMKRYPFHVTGEEYLFVSLDVLGGYAHHYVVAEDGIQKDVRFELIEVSGAAGA